MTDFAQNEVPVTSHETRSRSSWSKILGLAAGAVALLALSGKPTPPDPHLAINSNTNRIDLSSTANILQSGIMDTESQRGYVAGQVLVSSLNEKNLLFPFSPSSKSNNQVNIIEVNPGSEWQVIDQLGKLGIRAQPNYIYTLTPSVSQAAPNPTVYTGNWEDRVLQTDRPDVQAKINDLTPIINANLRLIEVDTGCALIPQFHGQATQYSVIPSGALFTGKHGTNVASQMIGDSGIIPGGQLSCINAFQTDGSAFTSDLVAGLAKAKEIGNGRGVVNNSWGYIGNGGVDLLLNNAVIDLANAGNMVVFANGNPQIISPFVYPGALSETTQGIIVSSSSTTAGRLSYFSNAWGSNRFISPGERVFAFDTTGEAVLVNGTSFSSPMLNAIAALYWSQNLNLTNTQLEQLMLNNSVKVNSPNSIFGNGTFVLPKVLGLKPDPFFTHSEITPNIAFQGDTITITLSMSYLDSSQSLIIELFDGEGNILGTKSFKGQNGINQISLNLPTSYEGIIYPKIKIGSISELDLQEIFIYSKAYSGQLIWGDSFEKTFSIRSPISYEKTDSGYYFSLINKLPKRNQIIVVPPNPGAGDIGPVAGVDKGMLGQAQAFEILATEVLSTTGVGFLSTPTDLDNSQLAIFSNQGVFKTTLTDGIKYIQNVEKLFDGNVIVGMVHNDSGLRKLIWLDKDINSVFRIRTSSDLLRYEEIILPTLSHFSLEEEDQFEVEKDSEGLKLYITTSNQIIIVNLDTKEIVTQLKEVTQTSSIAIGNLDSDGIDDYAYAVPGVSQTILKYYLSTKDYWQEIATSGYEKDNLKYFVGASSIINFKGSPAVYTVHGASDLIWSFENGISHLPVRQSLIGSIQHFHGHIPGTDFLIAITGPITRNSIYLGVSENLVLIDQLSNQVTSTSNRLYLPVLIANTN